MASKETYKGTEIFFDEKEEVWYYLNEGTRVWDASLKKLKEKMDKFNRSKFERIAIWFIGNRYRSGNEKEWQPTYIKATITSVDPNGNAFIVPDGKKSAVKENIKWRSYLYLDTPENRKRIAEFEKESKLEFEAKMRKDAARESFEMLDGKKIMQEIYGESV